MGAKYVHNTDLLCEIFEMKSTGRVSNELGEMIFKIAKQLSTHGSFRGYTREWREDMIMHGVETCLRYIGNFDIMRDKRPNVFAYITTVVRYSFLTMIKKEKKHLTIKDELHNKMNFETQCEFEKGGCFNYEVLSDKKRNRAKKKPK